jgi:hypothetical protein
VEILLEDELTTIANRAAAVAGGVEGGVEAVLTTPQPTRSMGTMQIRIERAMFLPDMPVLRSKI